MPSRSKRPGVLMLPAFGAPPDAAARMMDVLDNAGVASRFVELTTQDLSEWLATCRDALAALAAESGVSSDELFLFGHSVGGVLAPLVAANAHVAGVVVYGTLSRRWCDMLCDGARRQFALAGLELDDIDRETRHATELYRWLLREGHSSVPPELAGCIAARDVDGERLHGASIELWRALDALDLESAWRAVRAPVLALRGEHDWIVALDDHERIASWAPHGEAQVVAGVDHDMQRHASRRASFGGRGRGEASDDVALVVASWVVAHSR